MYNVLIAESNGGLRNLLASVLGAAGYEVMIAGDGMEALDVAEACGSRIDLLCANLTIAGVNGTSLAERLQARHPGMKVVLLVTENPWVISVDTRAADRHADFAVLRKPFTIEEFRAKVLATLPPVAA